MFASSIISIKEVNEKIKAVEILNPSLIILFFVIIFFNEKVGKSSKNWNCYQQNSGNISILIYSNKAQIINLCD